MPDTHRHHTHAVVAPAPPMVAEGGLPPAPAPLPQVALTDAARHHWYTNAPGDFHLPNGATISRRAIQTYGGPSPEFSCPLCQASEWLSRISRVNSYQPHECPTAARCARLCELAADDLWPSHWQDFRFSWGVDPTLPAARGLVMFMDEPEAQLWVVWNGRRNEQLMPRLRRQLAQTSTIDAIKHPAEVRDWGRYDYFFFLNTGSTVPRILRPPVPIIMYGHDMWSPGIQETLDHFQPEVLLTPYPTPWRQNFRIPERTQVVFYPQPEGTIFARPNLDPGRKVLDLLCTGTFSPELRHLYAPREQLAAQVKQIGWRFKVEISKNFGSFSWVHEGPAEYQHPSEGTTRYLNKWSEYLSTARFVIFGPCAGRAAEMLLMKYYECLGCGAIPIMPEVQDLALLGIRPWVHYIPLTEVWSRNDRLMELLAAYDAYRYIAVNAVNWYQANADRLLFETFEDLIQNVTGGKYPRRLVV